VRAEQTAAAACGARSTFSPRVVPTTKYSVPESLFLFSAMIELVIACLADLLHPARGTVVLPRFIIFIAVVDSI
jgi:hypothetical protein